MKLVKKAILLHGTGGSPEGNWFRWLENKLCETGFKVWLPQLPNAEKPNIKDWLAFVAQNAPFTIDDETIIIGHSSGATLALVLSVEYRIKSAIAVSPFVPMNEKYVATQWEANENLFSGIHIEEVLSHAKQDDTKRLVIFSDDDPYIPLHVFDYIVKMTSSKGILITGQGHFNLEKSETYREFPVLLTELIKRELIEE